MVHAYMTGIHGQWLVVTDTRPMAGGVEAVSPEKVTEADAEGSGLGAAETDICELPAKQGSSQLRLAVTQTQ